MFTNLIDTPGRTKIVAFFLNANPRAFHSEEVRRAVLESGPAVVSNLRHFARSGFLKTGERKGEVYYRLNSKFPYYEELKGLLAKKPVRVKDILSEELQRLNNVSLAVLTGIFTGQQFMPADLVIVGNPAPAVFKRVLEKIEKEMRMEINYSLFTEDEFDERAAMFERFMRDLFENPHLVVVDKKGKVLKEKIIAKKREQGKSGLKKRR